MDSSKITICKFQESKFIFNFQFFRYDIKIKIQKVDIKIKIQKVGAFGTVIAGFFAAIAVTQLYLLAALCGRRVEVELFGNGLLRGRAFKKGGITHTFERSFMPSTGGGKAPNGATAESAS